MSRLQRSIWMDTLNIAIGLIIREPMASVVLHLDKEISMV